MSEITSRDELPFVPGDILTFSSVSELRDFENLVANVVRPNYHQAAWSARTDIEELIRPKINGHNFNGQLRDISLTVMDEPYLRLIDARERGIAFSNKGGLGGSHAKLKGEYSMLNIPHYTGFQFQANAHSTGRGDIGKISTELWYFPFRVKPGMENRSVDNDGKVIKRVIAKPQFELDSFIELSETSRQIGFTLLQDAMRHPISVPIRN